MSAFRRIGPVDRVPLRGARRVETPRGPVAIFRTGDGRFFALDDRCPHLGGPLSEGLVCGDRVVCPLHDTEVCLSSGEATTGPGTKRTASHAVEVRDGFVFLAVDATPFGGGGGQS